MSRVPVPGKERAPEQHNRPTARVDGLPYGRREVLCSLRSERIDVDGGPSGLNCVSVRRLLFDCTRVVFSDRFGASREPGIAPGSASPASPCRIDSLPDVSGESDLGNKPRVDEETVMDVIVWAESEERERWWRQGMGVAPAGERGVGIEAGELTTSGFSGAPRMRGSAVRSVQGVSAA